MVFNIMRSVDGPAPCQSEVIGWLTRVSHKAVSPAHAVAQLAAALHKEERGGRHLQRRQALDLSRCMAEDFRPAVHTRQQIIVRYSPGWSSAGWVVLQSVSTLSLACGAFAESEH